jgi:putative serine protease PepD
MPLDDDADDDASAFGPPLPPDDRLWRHPSEVSWVAPAATTAAPSPHDRGRPWAVALIAGMAGAALAVSAVAMVHGLDNRVVEHDATTVPHRSAVSQTLTSATTAIAALAQQVAPAVVRVEAASDKGTASGSGVVLRAEGYVLTTAHLLEEAERVMVVTADGASHGATVVGVDPTLDVAVVKVSASGLRSMAMGSSKSLVVGQAAVAIGAPGAPGDSLSVTSGVISALDRKVSTEEGSVLRGMIQIDAPVPPDAAGGALVDGSGALIGITTSLNGDPPMVGLGFATPIEMAAAAATDIIATGKARHGWLGVEGDDLDRATASSLGVAGGAHVRTVVTGSPAAKAGIAVGDVIVAVGTTSVSSMSQLSGILRQHRPGDTLAVSLLRGSDRYTVSITLADQ